MALSRGASSAFHFITLTTVGAIDISPSRAMSSSMRYEPMSTPPGESLDEIDEGHDEGHDANELDPLAPNGSDNPPPSLGHSFLGGLLTTPHSRSSSVGLAPITPISSDGVFTNIPAKPSSSRDRSNEEEMGPDEWIFMSPEQRKKLAPPVCRSANFDHPREPHIFSQRNTPESNATGLRGIPLNTLHRLYHRCRARMVARWLSSPRSTRSRRVQARCSSRQFFLLLFYRSSASSSSI